MLLSLFIIVVFVAINALVVLVVDIISLGTKTSRTRFAIRSLCMLGLLLLLFPFAGGKQFNLSLPLKFCDLFLCRFAK